MSGLGASFTAFWTTAHWMAVGAIVNVVYIAVFVVAVAIGMRPTEERRWAEVGLSELIMRLFISAFF